jgi:hypothetical protein
MISNHSKYDKQICPSFTLGKTINHFFGEKGQFHNKYLTKSEKYRPISDGIGAPAELGLHWSHW